jgi:hypothetical protein
MFSIRGHLSKIKIKKEIHEQLSFTKPKLECNFLLNSIYYNQSSNYFTVSIES